MESVLSSGEDFLIGPLSYDVMKDQSSYVTDRRQTVTFSSVPSAGPGNNVRTLKFNIADPSGFLDLSTLMFAFDVVNDDAAKALQPLTGIPHCCFTRMVIRVSSALVEDVQYLAKTEELLSRFMSYEKRLNMANMGFGLSNATNAGNDHIARAIPAGGTRRVLWRPISSGLLNSGKMLPALLLGAGGLSFEFEIPELNEIVRNHADDSQLFHYENMTCLVDSIRLTSELMDQYSSMLLSGRSIMIPYQSFDCSLQHLPPDAGSYTLNIAKQYTRLATMFCSLDQEEPVVTRDVAGILSRHVNKFYLPHTMSQKVESFISINNKRWPDFNTKSTAEHWNRMNRALGTMSSIAHGTNIGDAAWGSVPGVNASSFIFAWVLEKAAHHGSSSSGENVTTGGLVSLHLLNVGSGVNVGPTRAYICALYDSVLELKDTGASVYS